MVTNVLTHQEKNINQPLVSQKFPSYFSGQVHTKLSSVFSQVPLFSQGEPSHG